MKGEIALHLELKALRKQKCPNDLQSVVTGTECLNSTSKLAEESDLHCTSTGKFMVMLVQKSRSASFISIYCTTCIFCDFCMTSLPHVPFICLPGSENQNPGVQTEPVSHE
jgi:hypothetical protein